MSGARIEELGPGRIGSRDLLERPAGDRRRETGGTAGPSFGEALEDALRTVDGNMTRADRKAVQWISGEGGDLHDVLLEMQQADLSFRTMLQVRNKLLEAYKEIMRMPV